MERFARWAALLTGSLLLLYFALGLILAARVMAPFGGIPWSWDFVWLNVRWAVLLALGLVLLGSAVYLFVRAARDRE